MAAPRTDRLNLGADRLLATGFAVVTQVEIWVFSGDADFSTGVRVVATILTLIASSALAFCRSWPLLAYCLNAAAVLGLIAVGYSSDIYQWTNLIATYAIAARGTPRQAWTALPVSVGGVVAYFWRFPFDGGPMIAAFVAAMWVVGWLAGRMYGARVEEARLRRERDVSLQLATAQRERLALEDERRRIARELHDIIGQSVNVMVVHAGAGRQLVETDPATARHVFTTIEDTGRAALGELDRVLAVLRRDGGAADLQPTPGLGDLRDLTAAFTDAGLPVDLHVSGDADAVPSSVGLAAYRIVQEALTNTMKHAAARCARVDVDIGDRHLELRVVDDGTGAPSGVRPGRGLLGIGERVAMHGGQLTFGTGDDGGFGLTGALAWDPTP